MNQPPYALTNAEPFQAFLADIALLGVSPVAEGGRRYAVLAAKSNMRWWLLPMENRRAAAAGMDMLQPGTLSTAMAKAALRRLVRFVPDWVIGWRGIRFSDKPQFENLFGNSINEVAYFTGTDGPHRKTALQLMASDGKILGYAKLSRASHIRPYIQKEAAILAELEKLNIESADFPSVTSFRDDRDMTMLITDSIKSASHQRCMLLGTQHLAFLTELRVKTEQTGFRAVLDNLMSKSGPWTQVADVEWNARFRRVDETLRPFAHEIPSCLAHGDFTPWNSFIQNGRLYVFDWEYAAPAWPVGFDFVHFHLAAAPSMEVHKLTRMLGDFYFNGDTLLAARSLLASLACHAAFYLGRLGEVNSPLSAWPDSQARAAMIEHLLAELQSPSR